MSVPLPDQIASVKREIAMRHAAYPKWVKGGRMTAREAAHEIDAMEAVLETLEGLAGLQRELDALRTMAEGRT